jgi:type II secretory pathway predicted ATPase ExeA/phage tail protein X
MDYYSLLELEKEPFSNSPDPDFFYESATHVSCLQQLELAVHLCRGLNVVMGRVGTGKTTLSRELVRRLDKESGMAVHLVLDPSFASAQEFLLVVEALVVGESQEGLSAWQRKERIKKRLFAAGIEENTLSVLIIDEGQKLSSECLEIVRELLNYETNTGKLLQVIIFAQEEFGQTLEAMENFQDRVNLLYRLGPMSFKEMRAMIHYRLQQSAQPGVRRLPFFTFPALWLTYRLTRGYPRKVIHICHRILLTLIIRGRTRITWNMVMAAARAVSGTATRERRQRTVRAAILAVVAVIALGGWLLYVQGGSPLDEFFVHPGRVNGTAQSTADSSAAPPDVKVRQCAQESVPGVTTASTPPRKNGDPEGIKQKTEGAEAVFGAIRVRSGDTLYHLIRGVYGLSSVADVQQKLDEVLAVNPALSNRPEHLPVGTRVVFPVPEPVKDPFGRSRYWVRLDRSGMLESIYRMHMHHRDATRIVIHRRSQEGYLFSLLLDQGFLRREDALEAASGLQTDGEQGGEVIDTTVWGEDCFFSLLPNPRKEP